MGHWRLKTDFQPEHLVFWEALKGLDRFALVFGPHCIADYFLPWVCQMFEGDGVAIWLYVELMFDRTCTKICDISSGCLRCWRVFNEWSSRSNIALVIDQLACRTSSNHLLQYVQNRLAWTITTTLLPLPTVMLGLSLYVASVSMRPCAWYISMQGNVNPFFWPVGVGNELTKVYDGGRPCFYGSKTPDTQMNMEIPVPPDFSRFGHSRKVQMLWLVSASTRFLKPSRSCHGRPHRLQWWRCSMCFPTIKGKMVELSKRRIAILKERRRAARLLWQ